MNYLDISVLCECVACGGRFWIGFGGDECFGCRDKEGLR